MKTLTRVSALLAILALSLVSLAQTPPAKLSPVGTWIGTAENQGNFDDITIIIEKKDDGFTGKINDVMGMFVNVEIKNLSWKDDKVSFEFPGAIGGTAFNLKADLVLTEKTLKGTWTMIEDGSSGALDLTRK